MPVHDWTRVDAGIFHAFHQQWIIALTNALNAGLLPSNYYALPEQHAPRFSPDVLTLERTNLSTDGDVEEVPETSDGPSSGSGSTALLAKPKLAPTAETDMEFYRRKQTAAVVRHVSGDRVVAMVEVVAPANKSGVVAMRQFVDKAAEFLERQVHLLIVDLLPPTRRDPRGIHGVIWEEITGHEYEPPTHKPYTLAAYETDVSVRAYVQSVGLSDVLPDMPLFLEPDGCVEVPLDATYRTAFGLMPRRWSRVLEA